MISVILPVYKVERYIGACINSLLRQTYTDYEVVLVNDGTPDSSVDIARNILASQKTIQYQIIETENRGVSAARNTGLAHANGEYIVMLDSDDVIHTDFLKDFADLICKHPDVNVFSCGFTVVGEENCNVFSLGSADVEVCARDTAQIRFFERQIKFLLPALLIKKSFLNAHKLRFDEKVRYSEDVQFIWRCLAYNDTDVVHLHKNNYNYVLHPQSTMTSSGIEKIMTFCGGMERLYRETKGLYCDFVNEMLMPQMYFSMLHGVAKMLRYQDFCVVYDKTNCVAYIQLQKKHGRGIQVRLTAAAMLVSKRIGYTIMRKL